jgi:hypothetical protein
MNTEQERRQRRRAIIQQLQERNQSIEDKLERLEIELNLNINELLSDIDQDDEKYNTSVESTDEISSVEIIPSPLDRKLRTKAAVVTQAATTPTPKKKTKKEECKESLQKASAWALDRRRERERRAS